MIHMIVCKNGDAADDDHDHVVCDVHCDCRLYHQWYPHESSWQLRDNSECLLNVFSCLLRWRHQYYSCCVCFRVKIFIPMPIKKKVQPPNSECWPSKYIFSFQVRSRQIHILGNAPQICKMLWPILWNGGNAFQVARKKNETFRFCCPTGNIRLTKATPYSPI